nr:hypothetical protein [Spirochaetota bacterium]
MKNCFLKDNAFFMILLFFLTVLLGCPPDAVVPENKEPVINSLTASATTVEAKTKITLTCVASDPENASLTYTWQASIGTLASTSGDKTEWTAPASPCSAIMTV